MTTHLHTVDESDVVGHVRDLMLDNKVHGVPVLDRHDHLVGIVTASDLVEEWAPATGVVTAMSTNVHEVSPHTSLVDAARMMRERQIHHLVVTHNGGVLGIVSSFDLLGALAGDVEAHTSRGVPGGQQAQVGDIVVVRRKAIDSRECRGVITGVRGEQGTAPFTVRWLDDPHAEPHDVLFFPGTDDDIEGPTAEPS